jgi:gamma-glutamylcyclotransferase (GGCT)/AIG2-like uncharacterized protein YtfP
MLNPAPPSTATQQPQRLFCYGTLQIPAVLEAVLGHPLQGRPAGLPGYTAFRIRGETYPGLAPRRESTTPGRLYVDVAPSDLLVLDRFEGYLYRRTARVVSLPNGRRVRAWVYLLAAGRENMLVPSPWRLGAFLRTGYQRFMQRFVRDRRALYVSESR